MIIVLIGVTGSGKTTVGKLIADLLGWPFYDADDFHPEANIIKMRSGIPLTDADRAPWLHALERLIADSLSGNHSAVLACSALKEAYREHLRAPSASDPSSVRFVYLRISPVVAEQRLQQRPDHFMPPGLVPSQFEALEEPADALIVEATLEPREIASEIRQALGL
ncbi:MAG: gluconokinase [Blastocatellia bacterium]|nr:gluconokinase [Blastocatellia bacterium]